MLSDKDKKDLNAYLLKIENSFKYREQISEEDVFELHDKSYIFSAINRINHDNKGVNIKVVNNVNQLPVYIKNMVDENETSVRFIAFINYGDLSPHSVVFDCLRLKNKGISVLGIESADSKLHDLPLEMAKRCEKISFNNITDKVSLRILSSRQQSSNSECMIYSLALAKMLFKERENLLLLHEKNLNDGFDVEEDLKSVVKQLDTDKYLLPSFMKHCQSTKRVNEYLSTELDGEIFGGLNKNTCEVNKRHETLIQRHKRTLVWEGKTVDLDTPTIRKTIHYNNSIFLKREREIEKLLGIYKNK